MENTIEESKNSLIYVITAFTLTCFRAIRHSYRFEFDGKTRNLAIFGLNGFGKSSIVDALEFVVSKFGSIERLGTEENLNPIFHSEVPNYMKSNKPDSIFQDQFHF